MPIAMSRRAVVAGVAASLAALDSRAAPAPAATPAPTSAPVPSPPITPAPGPRLLEARAATLQLAPTPAKALDILSFDGSSPGPLLRYRQGEELNLRVENKLDRPISVHFHGLRGENDMDGAAPLTQAPIPPGGRFDYRRMLPDAGLFIYRPFIFGESGKLVGRGLKGLLLVEETVPLEADADIVLALDDWRLDAEGRPLGPEEPAAGPTNPLGPLFTVNGKAEPLTREAAPGARVRLRLANLSAARLMVLTFEGVEPHVIAIDGQPCDAFEPVRKTLPAAPGARFDLMFDLPAAEGQRARLTLRGDSGADRDVLVLNAKGAAKQTAGRKPVAAAPENPLLPAEIKLAQSKKVDIVISRDAGGFLINSAHSKGYDGPPLFRVARGTPVTLGFINKTDFILAPRPHGFAVRLLHDLDDGWEPYWRNGVVVPPQKTKHVAFLADSPGKWALHDDILDHESAGLATWFEVT
jgi:FtsP/CotA-like multicopper oxidase with cupredoxin domain